MTLRIISFDWDEHNLRHIEDHPAHPFQRDAVEELFLKQEWTGTLHWGKTLTDNIWSWCL